MIDLKEGPPLRGGGGGSSSTRKTLLYRTIAGIHGNEQRGSHLGLDDDQLIYGF